MKYNLDNDKVTAFNFEENWKGINVGTCMVRDGGSSKEIYLFWGKARRERK